MRVLIVEDEPRLSGDLEHALRGAGYAIDTAMDGERADFAVRTEAYDAVVLDLGLPYVDGLTLLRRWGESGLGVPVLVLTARGGWHEGMLIIGSAVLVAAIERAHARAAATPRPSTVSLIADGRPGPSSSTVAGGADPAEGLGAGAPILYWPAKESPMTRARFTWLGAAVPILAGVVALTPARPAAQQQDALHHWPQWRGPQATGVSSTAAPPLRWSETENITWKVEVPGRGHASPVVWGDRLFLLTAVPLDAAGDAQHAPRGGVQQRGRHRFMVLAIDRRTGRTIWERVATEQEPHEAGHFENSTWASSSPVTDGRMLFAYFESFGLYAYDMEGTLVWQKDLGDKRMRNQFGEGSTPALHGNTLVIVWDHLNGSSFVVALDKRDGRELWRVPREEIDTWATPLVVDVNGRPQVIVPGMRRNRAYDLQTGAVVWDNDGLTMNPIPSPVYANGLVFLMSGFQGNDLRAIRVADAKGNIDATSAVVWSFDRDTPYVPSPVLVGGILYFLKTNSGILSAFDAATGKPHYQNQRLDGAPNIFASPVAAGGRVFFTGQEGTTVVIRSGPTFEILAKNSLNDGFDASPALAGGDIFLRGHKYLYCIGE